MAGAWTMGLRTQPVQPVDGLLTEAEGVIHIALAGTLRVLTANLGVKAEEKVRRRVEKARDAAHDQRRWHRDLTAVVGLDIFAHGGAADVDLICQLLRVDGLAVDIVAVHQIGQPVAEHVAEAARGLVDVFAHEWRPPFLQKQKNQLFSEKDLTNR